jgi:hypothetical protein
VLQRPLEQTIQPRMQQLSRPPSLGTIVPQPTEPPVAQHIAFARPTPNVSSRTLGADGEDHVAEHFNLRPCHSASFLHAQLRYVRRQLDIKDEEIARLRRQRDTRENLEVGTLCEQLRQANRDCRTWRKRAEAAERRIASFETFIARFREIRRPVAERPESEDITEDKR